MSDLKTMDQASLALAFLVPGVIILFVRAQLLTGRLPSGSDGVLAYFTVSVVYHALTLPALSWLFEKSGPLASHTGLWFVLTVVFPALFGGLLGLNAKFSWTRRSLGWVGLNTLHVLPTAWDWRFVDTPAFWVIIKLKNGTKFAGYCGSGSFMSSDPKERDIYIERIYDIDEDEKWIDRGQNGLLISHGEISTIEFWPYKE